jgi:ligand-binding SRPBCC domain-containing protein
MSDAKASADISAPADKVWSLVSDLPRMGEWSPENTGGRWVGGATGPTVGARFRGSNRKGLRRWSTTVTVTAADEGQKFSFDVTYGPVAISTWEYTFNTNGNGTTVVEEWTDRRPTWMKLAGVPVMGVTDRGEHNRRGMEQTLARLKATAES